MDDQKHLIADERIKFHLEEYKLLKTEIIEERKAAGANFRFALGASGGIAAWILTNHPTNVAASLLPLSVSSVFFIQNWGIERRLNSRLTYLQKLEEKLAIDGAGFQTVDDAAAKNFLGILPDYIRVMVERSSMVILKRLDPSNELTLPKIGYAQGVSWSLLFIGSALFLIAITINWVVHKLLV